MIVWVARDEPQDGPLSSALRARGLDVVLEPVVERHVMADPSELLAGVAPDDWLVLTSPFAIEAVSAATEARRPRVAVVGESSRRLAEARGLRVALVGADGHGETLFAALREQVTRGVVWYPRSARATPPTAWAEVDLRSPVLYDTRPRAYDGARVRGAAAAAVAAPSQVEALGDVSIPLVSIGRSTSAAMRRAGREPVAEAAYPTFEGLADAVAAYLQAQAP